MKASHPLKTGIHAAVRTHGMTHDFPDTDIGILENREKVP
jgi:hypothetical protein